MNKDQRFDSIDALRGLAMLWMTFFHFSFDLNYFGYVHIQMFVDPFWSGQRTMIVTLFLFCAGLGQAVAVEQQQPWPRFWRRWAQIVGCALLVTAGSYWMFPRSFIYFGVLHGIALMLIIARLTAGWGRWLWLAGALAIGMKYAAEYFILSGAWPDSLNGAALNWLGLISRKPITEDYVPLIPWMGVMWWGMAAGQWALTRRRDALTATLPRALKPFAFMGRWSLSYYMLHQPVLMGALMAFAALK